jgi:hypothetical protein
MDGTITSNAALACSGSTGPEPALPFKEQGAAASFFFGYFLLREKKVTSTGLA